MLGTGLQFNLSREENCFYNSAKARRDQQNQQQLQTRKLERAQSNVAGHCKDKSAISRYEEPENRAEELPEPVAAPGFESSVLPLTNVERFLEAITPSVPAQYLSKTTMRDWRTCDVEFQPYFVLGDLWESFKECSAYGAGVPLVLNGSDPVIQYYVPYLSGIQIYTDSSKLPIKSRRTSEDSDCDYFSRDSSSGGSSDSERDRIASCPSRQQYQYPFCKTVDVARKLEIFSMTDQQTAMQEEGFSSDDSEENSQVELLFQYLEHSPPYCREPLADKITDLAIHFPELKSLRSCDVVSSSWFSVAWYPIYRIPTGPTLKDLDACFLTYHSLYTPVGDAQAAHSPAVFYPSEIDGIPKIYLPVFGAASYKFKGSAWTSNSGTDSQLMNSLSKAAGDWLRALQCLTLTLVSDKKTSYWPNRIVDTVSTKALLLKSKFAVGENLIFKGAGDFSSAVNLKLHGTE